MDINELQMANAKPSQMRFESLGKITRRKIVGFFTKKYNFFDLSVINDSQIYSSQNRPCFPDLINKPWIFSFHDLFRNTCDF